MMKSLLTLVFVGHALLMPLCMIPMAMAADMPMHDATERMEMIMTPMNPLSPAHCEHCAHVSREQPDPMNSGCAGHCLSQASDVLGTLSATSPSILASAVLPPSLLVAIAAADDDQHLQETHGPPGDSLSLRTIVLLE